MSISFREEALIRAWERPRMIPVGGKPLTNEDLAEQAQKLAEAGCGVWGHDEHDHQPSQIGTQTIANYGQGCRRLVCARCGKERTL